MLGQGRPAFGDRVARMIDRGLRKLKEAAKGQRRGLERGTLAEEAHRRRTMGF